MHSRTELWKMSIVGKHNAVRVRHDTSRLNGGFTKKTVTLLIVAYSQLDVAGKTPGLLVITAARPSELNWLCSDILPQCRHVDGDSSSHALALPAFLEEPRNAADGEGQTSFAALQMSTSSQAFSSLACALRKPQQARWLLFLSLRPWTTSFMSLDAI
eukprot:GHVU01056937.1.p1 GENE.GHVU01056937.1~~GHVU01056937.1.p1  ORF type:complete len:158 (+),score=7.94 GHVU01056937.1:213-686(+)